MENKQLSKRLERYIDEYNDYTRNNVEQEETPFYKYQIAKYSEIICNLCRQIESLHSEENKPIL
jgi:hypothetical protein